MPVLNVSFENVSFENVNFENVSFENVSFENVSFENVGFENVGFYGLLGIRILTLLEFKPSAFVQSPPQIPHNGSICTYH
jgi:hypothetical protein